MDHSDLGACSPRTIANGKNTVRSIKVMADYGCFPLWEASPGLIGNIDPETLPISAPLKSRLLRWSHDYDSTLNVDDPLNSGFRSPEEQASFDKDGANLAEALRKELGSRE